jgi:intracellular sulfur oxidation DsrE/DsrF family protein
VLETRGSTIPYAASANADVTRRFGEFSKAGLAAQACGNTMKTQNVTLKDPLPGFGIAERGEVVRIAELQSAGLRLSAALTQCLLACAGATRRS